MILKLRTRLLWHGFLGAWTLTMVHYGAVAPWAVAATALAMAALNGLALLLLPEGLGLSKVARGWLIAVAAVFLLQFLPLGPLLFPATHAMRQTHGVGGFWPGTADAFLTLRTLAQFGACVLAALLVIRLRNAGLSTSYMMKGLGAVLAIQAAYGIFQHVAPLKEIPFYGPRVSPDAISGTMVNRNTFAGLMAMGIVIAGAIAYSRFAWTKRRTDPKRIQSGILWSAAAILLLVALILSKSRGGALAAFVGIAMIPFLFKGTVSSIGALALAGAGAVGIALADPSVLIQRFEELDPFEIGENDRVRIWSTTLAAALHQPILGFGIGAHPHAYHPFQPPELVQDIRHAHNEYVNFFFEGGIVFAGVMIAGLILWSVRSWKAMQRLTGPERFLPTAAICAAAAEAVHSVVDFDCRITSAGLLFAALVGIAAAVIRSEGTPSKRSWAIATVLTAVAGLLLLILPLQSEPLVEKALASDSEASESLCRRVLGLSPYQFQAAWVLAQAAESRSEAPMTAGRYGVAADLWPAHPGLQRDAGTWFWERWREDGDKACYDRAARSFQRLFAQRPTEVTEVMAALWERERPLSEYEGLLPSDKPAAAGTLASFLVSKGRWVLGQELFDRAVPSRRESVLIFDRFADALREADQGGMEALVRDRRLRLYAEPNPVAESARAWGRLEAWDEAIERATQACRMDPTKADWRILRGDLRRSRGDKEGALEDYVAAIQIAPLEVGHLQRRASLYLEMNLPAQAAEDLRRVLRARPGDRAAVFALARALSKANDNPGACRVLDDYLSRAPQDAEAVSLRASLR